ncbi:hypothetical protein CRI94_04925 [Longibacter salinarum]|uniref:Uncharacterized protein n=1 Tax=Longibacter salinarum TaxID=1850348 RepID=A0A2A8D0H8_9BACT|nr:hypothetical protein [Longibacter salinarum]PEN14380.1 hypothetical protein CRI94_04925 [Longibacter salinarum]
MTNPPPKKSDRSIHFHNSFDARPRERALIRDAISCCAPELSETLSPEWIVVREVVADEPLYLVHYRTTRTTITATSAEELAEQIRDGVFDDIGEQDGAPPSALESSRVPGE